jgi:hypothetical protein
VRDSRTNEGLDDYDARRYIEARATIQKIAESLFTAINKEKGERAAQSSPIGA